jgi:hypothetical protein
MSFSFERLRNEGDELNFISKWAYNSFFHKKKLYFTRGKVNLVLFFHWRSMADRVGDINRKKQVLSHVN